MSSLVRLPRAFGEQRVLSEQFHPARIGRLVRTVLGDAHVAGGDAAHLAVLAVDHFRRGEAGIDFDAERLGLGAEPAAHHAERADVAMVIVHQRRHQEIRQPDRAARRHPIEPVVLDLGLERAIGIVTPIGNQLVETRRIDHRARENMRADFRTLLHHDDREIGIELLETDRRTEARRSGADDHDIEFHGLARRQLFGAHILTPDRLTRMLLTAFVSDFSRKNNYGNATEGVSPGSDPS